VEILGIVEGAAVAQSTTAPWVLADGASMLKNLAKVAGQNLSHAAMMMSSAVSVN
jgi:hypothetical protein